MRAAGHSCSPRNNNATVSGQQLADLFLHVGSDLLFEATDRTEADMNDLCLLFSSSEHKWSQQTRNGWQRQARETAAPHSSCIKADSSPGQRLLK